MSAGAALRPLRALGWLRAPGPEHPDPAILGGHRMSRASIWPRYSMSIHSAPGSWTARTRRWSGERLGRCQRRAGCVREPCGSPRSARLRGSHRSTTRRRRGFAAWGRDAQEPRCASRGAKGGSTHLRERAYQRLYKHARNAMLVRSRSPSLGRLSPAPPFSTRGRKIEIAIPLSRPAWNSSRDTETVR